MKPRGLAPQFASASPLAPQTWRRELAQSSIPVSKVAHYLISLGALLMILCCVCMEEVTGTILSKLSILRDGAGYSSLMLKEHIGTFGEHGSEATSNQWTPSAPGGPRKVVRRACR